MSFSSGSCGNCYFLRYDPDDAACRGGSSGSAHSTDGFGIVIDAGVSHRRLKKLLEQYGFSLDDFSAIFVTHDHFDHIRSLDSYCRKMNKPVYATETLHSALENHPFARLNGGAVKMHLKEGEWNSVELFSCQVAGASAVIDVRPFVVPHDATQTVGYAINFFGHKFVIMTDVGRVTEESLELAGKADTLVMESNYDVRMLAVGPYPEELRRRIRGGHGHISNDECAEALERIWHPGLKSIFLCHLSENNNTPSLAFETSSEAMKRIGASGTALRCLPRRTPSELYTLSL